MTSSNDARKTEIAEGAACHLRHNTVAHVIEGGLFIGGLAFVSAETLLPTVIKNLGGGNWLISLMPVMMMAGFMLPPIFTAHWIDRQRRFMPLLRQCRYGRRRPGVSDPGSPVQKVQRSEAP